MRRGPATGPAPGLPDRSEFARRWSAAHGGADPGSRFVAPYLAVVHRAALPLARAGVSPHLLTLVGLLVALAALVPADAGGRWLLAVPLVVVASALVDGIDGAVAVVSGRASAWGAVLDGVADRLADAVYAVVLWLVGAPAWLAVLAGGTGWLHEYVRARGMAAGMGGIGAVTAGERPTRVVLTAVAALVAGLDPQRAGVWATVGAAALAGVGVLGLAQLLPVVRRSLR